jgi:hypothetical protein
MKRLYLAIFGLPKPQREHAKLAEAIRSVAGDDFKQFIVPGGVGYVYESETLPWNMPFGQILHNGDTRIIVEIGEKTLMDGYGAAVGWLNTRRPRR